LPVRKVHKDVKKRLKTSSKANARNRETKSELRSLIKKIETNPVQENLKAVFSLLDKASRKNIIHKNTASRIKSRLSRLSNKPTKPGAEAKAGA
jgi:small subunit ribosomal protein S20